jgi:hypothetical protein
MTELSTFYRWVGCCLVFLMVVTTVAEGAQPAESFDGLERRKVDGLREVYVTPGATLEPYTKVAILECYVAFRKNWQRDYNRTARGAGQRITQEDMARIKQEVAQEFQRVFVDVLEKQGGYEVVSEAGEDVLLLRPAIRNLDVAAPDKKMPGMTTTIVTSAGQMTLYLELYDSATGDIIARITDRKISRASGGAQRSNSVVNRAEADRILRRWADILLSHLDAAKASQPEPDE